MVSGVKGLNFGATSNFSLNSLNFIQSEVNFVNADINGDIPDDELGNLSSDASNAVSLFGNNKNILSKKISDLITDKTKQPEETSKEAAPDMDLSLDDDIPSPPKV